MRTGQQLTYIRVRIRLEQPWRVGAPSAERSRQAALVDPDGDIWLPASGLAGSFAAHAKVHLTDGELGGVEEDPEEREKLRFFASRLWFLGVVLDGGEVRTRTGTAISRTRRAARKSGSHQIDEVYGTETATLYLRVDGDPEAVLGRLADWPVTVGGGITSGLGRAVVAEIRYRTVNLATCEGLLIRVQNPGGSDGIDSLVEGEEGRHYPVKPSARPEVARARIDIKDLFLAERPKETADELKDEDRWFHGTRWKGILRSRVEYIGRSLGLEICGAGDDGTWDGCGECGVCEVFGSSSTGVGRWAFHSTRLDQSSRPQLRQRVAIDRFTGGAANRKLLKDVTQTSMDVELVITRVRPLKQHHTWVAKALVLALRDLADGYLGVGGRSATGLGSVTVAELTVREELVRLVGDVSLARPALITAADLDLANRKESVDA